MPRQRNAIETAIKIKLWSRAGARCQYRGCNQYLWRDDLTLARLNRSHIAHIAGVEPNSARHDASLSPAQVNAFENLMLMCQPHHHLIDHDGKDQHPVDVLEAMKREHEERIELVTGFQRAIRSEVIRYGKAIGNGQPVISFADAWQAMSPRRYPARDPGVEIRLRNDRAVSYDDAFWDSEAKHLREAISGEVRPRVARDGIEHLSVFAIAPQPLLVLLGHLVSNMVPVETFQRQKSTDSWTWIPSAGEAFDYIVERPVVRTGPPALVLSLSGTISHDRVQRCFATDFPSIWEIRAPSPSTDFLRERRQLDRFCVVIRELLDEIKNIHGHGSTLHVFLAAPVSICVELGRQHTATADLPMLLYNEDHADRVFRPTLTITLRSHGSDGSPGGVP
jgi:hypothetical protein